MCSSSLVIFFSGLWCFGLHCTVAGSVWRFWLQIQEAEFDHLLVQCLKIQEFLLVLWSRWFYVGPLVAECLC